MGNVELGNGQYLEEETGKRRTRYSSLSPEQKKNRRLSIIKWKQNNYKRMMLQNSKDKAKALGVPFNLDIEDISIPEYCPVFGVKLEKGTGRASPNSPSVDRIIPSKGYTKGNIVIISYKANAMKNNGTLDEMNKLALFYTKLFKEKIQASQTDKTNAVSPQFTTPDRLPLRIPYLAKPL